MKRIRREMNRKKGRISITIFLLVCFIIGIILVVVANKEFTNSLEGIGGEIPQKLKSTQENHLRKNEFLLKIMAVKTQEIKEFNKDISKEEVQQIINNYAKILRLEDTQMYAVVDDKFYAFNVENISNYLETEWYQKAMAADEGNVIYTNAFYDTKTGEPTIVAATKIEGTNDILALNIFPQRIHTWPDLNIFPDGTGFYIADSKGNIIHQDDSDTEDNPDNVKKSIDEVYLELGIRKEDIGNVAFVESTLDNKAGIYTAKTYNDWRIIVRLPYEDMLSGTRTILVAYYSTIVLFSIAILLLAFLEKRADLGKTLYTRISDILSDSYYALYLVNYEKEQYTILKGSEYMKNMPKTGSYSYFMQMSENIMEEDAYKEFKETFSIENIRRLVHNNVKSFGGDFRRTFNSEFKWVSVRMIYNKEYVRKNNPEVIFAFQDADVRKEKEIEEKEVLRHSIETMQMATQTKNRFFANMSHDMRTPLNAIINFSNMARNQFDNKEKVLDYLGKINISSSQLLELINNILDVSKMEETLPLINKEEFNIRKSLEDIFSVFEEQAVIQEKNLSITYNIKHDYVLSDWSKIRQIVNNLASNALKYTKKDGNISVEINEIEGKSISKYTFKFIDTGIGMSKEFLKKIYLPFERETRFHSEEMTGTGLGMVIIRNNVQSLNGQIEIKSEQGSGSEIYVTLPLEVCQKAEKQNQKEVNEDDDLQDLSGKRILLVEDNELNVEIATEILEMQGIEITTAFDGKQALEIFKQSKEGYFDAILMDIQMPIMNGYEATECIRSLPRKDAKSIIILAVTANAFAEDIIRAEEAGMNEHISKPIDFKDLQKVLSKYMKEK